MKKLLCILLSALMMALPLSSLAEEATPTPAPFQAQALATEEKLEQMIPVLDSFANTMGIEGEYTYDIQRPDFIWTQLYLMGMNWADWYSEITQTSEELVVPASLMQRFAAASFNALQALPQIPGSNAGGVQEDVAFMVPIRYDAASDSYILNPSDQGENYIIIEGYAADAQGNLVVNFGWYGADNVRLGGFTAQMAGNATQTAAAQAQFPYSVKNVALETAGDFTGLTVTRCAIRAERVLDPQTTEEPMDPTATPEPTPHPTAEPEQPYDELKRGDEGDSVRRMQERLNELGYDCGKADGVFGADTQRALRYFQGDAGLKESGVATETTLETLYDEDAPEYRTYVQLKRGDSGIRVEKLQSALRKLGYLARPTDGSFGSDTLNAVKRFQKQAGLKQDGVAGEKTLRALYKSGAPKCKTYITLKKGDSGIRVEEMQKQLRKLGFMTKKANARYDNTTVKAVKAYLEAAGLKGDGRTAEASVIKGMFNYVKPTPKPTVAPTAEPTTKPTVAPTAEPTTEPTVAPTAEPTTEPTVAPTAEPTVEPTAEPTAEPTVEPTAEPTAKPTSKPTTEPTKKPEQAITDKELKAFVDLMKAKFPDKNYDQTASVNWLQKKLSVGQTGIYDAATKDAVKAYQKDNALKETGLVDQATLDLLAK